MILFLQILPSIVLIIDSIIIILKSVRTATVGTMSINDETGICKISMLNTKKQYLSNKKIKYAVLKVDHKLLDDEIFPR